MRTTKQFLGLAIAATLVAGIVVVFVKDTTPDTPIAQPTPTLTFATESPSVEETFQPSATEEPKPAVKPSPPKREPLPATGLPSQAILAVFALAGASVLAMERRRTR